ncbi:MAG: hypothetical protein ACOCNL_14440 [Acetivibrio ethanolgignens]
METHKRKKQALQTMITKKSIRQMLHAPKMDMQNMSVVYAEILMKKQSKLQVMIMGNG